MSRRFEPKVPKLVGTWCPPAPFLAQAGPCMVHPSLPKWQVQGAGEDMGGGKEQMHFVTRSRGVCVCRGKGCLGVWVHLLPLPASAGSLCTHGWQGPKGTAHGSLDFYPAVQTGRRQIRVSVGISSCQRHPQPLWAGSGASSLCPHLPAGHPTPQVNLGDAHFAPARTLFPSPLLSAGSPLADSSDARCWAAITPSPAWAGSHCWSLRDGKIGH